LPNRSFVVDAPDYAAIGEDVSLEAAIGELVDKEVCPELFRLVTDLAVAPDPSEEIQAYKQRNGVFDDPTSI